MRTILKFLSPPDFDKLARESSPARRAIDIVQAFYYLLLLVTFLRLVWRQPEPWVNDGDFTPTFPVIWTRYLPFHTVIDIFPYLFLTTAFLGAAFYKHWWGRAVVFMGVLQFVSFQASFKSPIHYYEWFPWLFGTFVFIFLPKLTGEIEELAWQSRKRILLVVWGFQAFFLLTFTNVGVSRLIGIIQQVARGELNLLNPAGYAAQLAEYTIQQPFINPIAKTIIENPLYAYPLVILSLYFFLFAFWAAFRPAILKIWAFFLLLNEVVVYLITTSFFYPNVLLILLLLFETPFLEKLPSAKQIVLQFPVFGWLFSKIASRDLVG